MGKDNVDPPRTPSSADAGTHRNSLGRTLQDVASARNLAFQLSEQEEEARGIRAFEERLESWARNAEEVMSNAVEMNNLIEEATRFSEASMSYSRNELLRYELAAEAVSVALGFGALISGIWGMNFDTDMNQYNVTGAFWICVSFIIITCLIIVWTARAFYRRGVRSYDASCARFGNNIFFKSINDDDYVLSLGASIEDSHCPQSIVDKLLRDMKEPARPIARGHLDSFGFSRIRTQSSSRSPQAH